MVSLSGNTMKTISCWICNSLFNTVQFTFTLHIDFSIKMKDLIIRNTQGSKILVFFIITMAVYLFMLLVTIPFVMDFSHGMKLLDMMPSGYNAEYVSSLMVALGEEGRHAYLFYQIPFDMIYPGLFAVTWCLVFAWFLKKINRLHSSLFYASYIPVFAALFDYLENFGIITIISTWPDTPVRISDVSNIFSVLKSFLTTIYFVSLIVLLIVFIVRYFRKRVSA